MNKKVIKLLFLNIFILLNINIFCEKYILENNWYYTTNIENANWNKIDLNKSLKKQQISLKRNENIYYKYELKLNDLKEYKNDIGLYCGRIEGKTEVIINNKKVFYSDHFDKTIFFRVDNNILTNKNIIIIKVNKYIGSFSARSDVLPYIDNYEKIINRNLVSNIFLYGVILILLLTGLYHLFFFNKKLKNYEYVLYFVCNLLIASYTFLKSPIKFYLIEKLNIHWVLIKKLDFLCLYLLPVFGLLFFVKAFSIEQKIIRKYILRIVFIITAIITLCAVILNFELMRYSLFIFYFLLFISFITYFYIVILEIKKNKDSIFILIGLVLLFIVCFTDIIGVWHIIKIFDKFPILPLGFFFFLYSIGFYLSRQFLKINLELNSLNINLEYKVKQRTFQLEQEKESKSQFFINLAHETKTPLTLISNYLDKDINKRGKSNEIEIVKDNINKLKNDMINFLDIEKLERGKIFYNHNKIIDLSNLLNIKISMFNEIAVKKSISIKSDIKDFIYTKIDPSAMDKIINNLIDNAIKYTNEGGKIEIILDADEKYLILLVKDNGIGIPEEQQKEIFNPLYQLNHEKRNIQGIGMGLNIAKKITNELDGKIEVESKLNKGSRFKITLKRYKLKDNDKIDNIKYEKPEMNIINVKLQDEIYDKERKSILIVEDNKQMLAYLQGELIDNYNVFYSLNGKEALSKLDKLNKLDLIISDIMMDEMDGYEFYDNLIKEEKYKSIPFMFLTAKSGKDNKIEGIKKGAVDYIAKPFNIDELKAKINSLINLQDALKIEKLEELSSDLYNHLVQKKVKKEINKIEDKKKSMLEKIYEEYKISKRQIEIISLLKSGKERKEIADILGVKLGTIATQLDRIYTKCGVNNKVELINLFRV